ncbi:MAG: response regulator [Candidatus Thermoplasmatota archaeon]
MVDAQPQVLWAEDNARDRMLIQDSMEDLGQAPGLHLVTDGEVLLEALERKRPDLIVLDLKMPRLGGIDVLHRIRTEAKWRALPVIIFSSGNRADELDQCRALGVVEIVEKPVDFDAFRAEVQRVVRIAGRPGVRS